VCARARAPENLSRARWVVWLGAPVAVAEGSKNLGKHGVRGKSGDVNVPRASISGDIRYELCRFSNWEVKFTRLYARVTLDGTPNDGGSALVAD
jgi:hypothetical protein